MKANKVPEIEIKETDQNFFHIEFTKIRKVKGSKMPAIDKHIQIYTGSELRNLQSAIDRQGILITGYDELRIVHDPDLMRKEQARLEQEKNDAEAERIRHEAKEDEKADAEKKDAEGESAPISQPTGTAVKKKPAKARSRTTKKK